MKKHYYLTLDTETANGLENPIVYDLGGAIHDRMGNIIETFSFIIWEIFSNNELMNTAYYKEKTPIYLEGLNKQERRVVTFKYARDYVLNLMAKYEVKAIIAYNAYFDYNALNNTVRHTNIAKYFFPYGTEIWDSLKMVKDTIAKQKTYSRWCEYKGYMTKHAKPQPQTKAEVVYKYITAQPDFIEDHMGLEDVMIEVEIFARCIACHQKMRRKLFEK